MKEFPTDIKFSYGWRAYQQRVLDGLDEYLKDGHLHVIAPPGSGKTVLGLEAAIRINQPTLILTPTIAIRNQWIQRFCEMFLQQEQTPAWVSHDIRKPGFLTVITYQGLHAACNDLKVAEPESESEEEVTEHEPVTSANHNLDNIVNGLKEQQVKTIVVDEAHHLKNEWWHTLNKVKKAIDPMIIGLTATPPYDVSATEWQRYLELNGPINIEISVPELIIEGDLCPHQDYVYLSLPADDEIKGITAFRQGIEELFAEIKADETLINAIENHPAWQNPQGSLDWIYTNLSYYSASLIFLNANGRVISKDHLDVIDNKKLKIPVFDNSWMEVLLDFYLYRDKEHFKTFAAHQKIIEGKLHRYGAIEKRQISFSQNKKVTGALTSSISKLDSIQHIVNFEYQQLGHNLRMVVLTDYIRKEFYINGDVNNFELNKIGVMTIFEKLRRQNAAGIKIGVLTGSLAIVPYSAYLVFREKVRYYGLGEINCERVPFASDYVLVEQSEQVKNDIVNLITQIFQSGEIEVLIGTKSLLGEGWDAPAINSLVLASFVGSFVLSNQMRGRAIRTQKGNLGKTGNIWHLCCIDPTTSTGGEDFDMLKRRFKSFVGISFKDGGGIENGVGRLNIPPGIKRWDDVEQQNKKALTYAADRESLKAKWNTALENGVTLIEEIKIPFESDREYSAIKTMYLNKTIANLLAALGFGMLDYLFAILQSLGRAGRLLSSREGISIYLVIIAITGFLVFGRLAFKALRLFIKYRDISKDVEQIANALLSSMVHIKVVKTDRAKLRVDSSVDRFGNVYCFLDGGTTYEHSAFINMLHEIVGLIDNPRYVIVRRNMFLFFVKQKDYHAVPELIGRTKASANYFMEQWQKNVGYCDLVFTRGLEGHQLLLASRMNSLSAQFDDSTERVSKWR